MAGRYRLDRQLGEGACGKVFLARDTKERGSEWAVKEVDYSGLPATEFKEARSAFQREAALLQQLRHPILPKVVDSFTHGACDYLVMERVEGPTLESMVAERGEPLTEEQVLAVGVALADALNYLHVRTPPVLYRDMKPSNVMVSRDGSVKLIDFGIARSQNPQRAGDTTAYGTPGFAPPEQYQGRSEPRSDVYALGVTLHRALTGYDPPQFGFDHPKASSLAPEVSEAFDRFLARMITKSVSERPSALEVREVLRHIAASLENSSTPPWLSGKLRRWQRWWRKDNS